MAGVRFRFSAIILLPAVSALLASAAGIAVHNGDTGFAASTIFRPFTS
jgi:hypothetical protein